LLSCGDGRSGGAPLDHDRHPPRRHRRHGPPHHPIVISESPFGDRCAPPHVAFARRFRPGAIRPAGRQFVDRERSRRRTVFARAPGTPTRRAAHHCSAL